MRTLDIGTQVGKYILLNAIGEGASGLVYAATHKYTKKSYVLKLVPLNNSWFRKEYEQEVQALSEIEHNNIVALVDHFTFKSVGVLVLERMSMDLLDYIEKRELCIDDIKEIFRQICHAIKYLHDNNMAHLDIKPENIFMNDIHCVKLGDFGSCFHWTPTNPMKIGKTGTSFYCAPEVKKHNYYVPAGSDIWSLGILLHVLCTGFWPYSAATDDLLHAKIASGDTKLLLQKLPEDSALIFLLHGMLQNNPARRFNMNQILDSDWLREEDFEIQIGSEGSSSETEVSTITNKHIFVTARSAPELTEVPITPMPSLERSDSPTCSPKGSPKRFRSFSARSILSKVTSMIKK